MLKINLSLLLSRRPLAIASLRLYALGLSICSSVRLSPKCALKARFSKKKLSNLELFSLLTTNRKSYIGYLKNTLSDPKIRDGGDPS